MTRSLYRTDLISLLLFARNAPRNQAVTRSSLVKRSLFSPEVILENWLPINGKRYTWICEEDGRIEGAASAKGDVVPTVWQIDYLQVDDEERCVALLETAGADAAERGVRKLFLYLDSTGTLSDVVRRVGFINYKKDYLYRYCGQRVRHAETAPNSYRLRSRNPADDFGLFQLYNATAPMPVRTAEGLTLDEWRETREHGSWLEQHREFIMEQQGGPVAWLRVNTAKGGACFEIVSHNLEGDGLKWLVNHTLKYLDGKSPILCVAPSFQAQLNGILEGSSFERVAEYNALVREIALKVKQPQFVPMRA